MQTAILMAKVGKNTKKKLDTPDAEITRVYSITNIFLKYKWQLKLINKEIIINLGF